MQCIRKLGQFQRISCEQCDMWLFVQELYWVSYYQLVRLAPSFYYFLAMNWFLSKKTFMLFYCFSFWVECLIPFFVIYMTGNLCGRILVEFYLMKLPTLLIWDTCKCIKLTEFPCIHCTSRWFVFLAVTCHATSFKDQFQHHGLTYLLLMCMSFPPSLFFQKVCMHLCIHYLIF
jgi:hypothetical protein